MTRELKRDPGTSVIVAADGRIEVQHYRTDAVVVISNPATDQEPNNEEADDTDAVEEDEMRILEPYAESDEAHPADEGEGTPEVGEAEQIIADAAKDDPAQDLDWEPPEEVFGVEYDQTVDRGAMAVRVGNSLRIKPGRFVDPEDVKALHDGPSYALRDEPEPPAAPELPDLTDIPDMKPLEPPRPPKVDKPVMPKKKVVRVVPKKKYRKRVTPDYTGEALDAEIEGVVEIDVWIDRNGMVKKARVVKGLGYGLDDRVVEAALRSTFNPVLADGHPVPSRYRLKYRFRMEW